MKTTQQIKSTAHYRQGRDFRHLALTPRPLAVYYEVRQ